MTRRATSKLISFVDLTHFAEVSKTLPDGQIADGLDTFYIHLTVAITKAGGRVVKFIGDAALIVFDVDRADRGVEALVALKESVDKLMEQRGWRCRLHVKIHAGNVVEGNFGAPGAERYDVIGVAVNDTARLQGSGVALSKSALDLLSDRLRTRFVEDDNTFSYR